MKVALLISGRATRYDVCLLPTLLNSIHEIDIFMSINDENGDILYYNLMKEKLTKYLKGCIIQQYIIPEKIINKLDTTNYKDKCHHLKKHSNGKYYPINTLSMFYNDNLSFIQAYKYADINNFEYDCYMKYRSDIILHKIPDTLAINNKLNSAVPLCNFISYGIHKKLIVCDAIAYGSRNIMNIYCNTYDYMLQKIELYNGKYFIAYESTLTDNIYENNVPIVYHNIPYNLDKNRRMFDIKHEFPIRNQNMLLNITDNNATHYIPPDAQV